MVISKKDSKKLKIYVAADCGPAVKSQATHSSHAPPGGRSEMPTYVPSDLGTSLVPREDHLRQTTVGFRHHKAAEPFLGLPTPLDGAPSLADEKIYRESPWSRGLRRQPPPPPF